MTVSSTPRRAGPYAVNGITTSFPFDFKVFDESDVGVVLTLADGSYSFLAQDSDYTIFLNPDQDNNPGGTVTYTGVGVTLTMLGTLPAEQDTDITNVGRFLPQVLEDALDRVTILVQQLQEVSDRTLQAAPGTTVKLAFPAPSSGKFIRWRADLTGLENAEASDNPGLQGILASAIGALSIGYLPPDMGALISTLQAELQRTAVRPERFMNAAQQAVAYLRLGTLDLTAPVQAALNTGQPVELTGLYPCGPLTSSAAVFGRGTLRNRVVTEATALLTMTGGSVSGINIDSPNPVPNFYGILCHGQSPLVEGVTFSGDYGHCIYFSDCRNARALKNTVKLGGSHSAVFVFESCVGFAAADNVIEEHTGFGIQARFSGQGSITGNQVMQRYYVQNFTAASANQTFAVSTGRSCMRFSVFCNGFFHPVTHTQTGTNTYSVAATGLTPGQPVAIYSFVGLECIQANSGCYGVTIENNTVGPSGDSGIVIGADYHNTGTASAPIWGSPDPSAVVDSDFPSRVFAHGNIVRGPILAAGVAVNNGTDCEAIGNGIEDVGYNPDLQYKAGVSLGLVSGGTYRDNNVNGTNGHCRAAVVHVGSQGLRTNPTIGHNQGTGCRNLDTLPNRSTTARSHGYNIVDAKVSSRFSRALERMVSDPSWSGGAYTSDYIVVGGSGIQKDTITTFGYGPVLKTVAGQVADLGPPISALQLFRNKLVRVSFVAKADNAGDSAVFQLFYAFPDDPDGAPPIQFTADSTTPTVFEKTIGLGEMSNLYLHQVGVAGVVRYSVPEFEILDTEG